MKVNEGNGDVTTVSPAWSRRGLRPLAGCGKTAAYRHELSSLALHVVWFNRLFRLEIAVGRRSVWGSGTLQVWATAHQVTNAH